MNNTEALETVLAALCVVCGIILMLVYIIMGCSYLFFCYEICSWDEALPIYLGGAGCYVIGKGIIDKREVKS